MKLFIYISKKVRTEFGSPDGHLFIQTKKTLRNAVKRWIGFVHKAELVRKESEL